MAFPKTTEELKQLLQGAAAAGAQPYILGAGTNILAPDEGLDALVICLKDALCGIRLLDEARIEAYAGESMAKAAVFAKNHALTGLEFAHGIPGTLGGGVYMNAGAYGGEIAGVLKTITYLDTVSGEIREAGRGIGHDPDHGRRGENAVRRRMCVWLSHKRISEAALRNR